MKIANRVQMRAIELEAMESLGISEDELIRRAGRAVADAAEKRPTRGGVAILAGRGKNGADGIMAGIELAKNGRPVHVFTVGYDGSESGYTKALLDEYIQNGGSVTAVEPANTEKIAGVLSNCGLAIDAVFGTGLDFSRDPGEAVRLAFEFMRNFEDSLLSVDIPSGMDPDTGETRDMAVKPDSTITFTLPKPAHFLSASAGLCGRLEIADIGIPVEIIDRAGIVLSTFESPDIGQELPSRNPNTHKGHYGRLLIIAGSTGYTGAAALAARAALRTGAGTVTLCVPERVYEIVAGKLDEAMVYPLPCDASGRFSQAALPEILRRMDGASAVLLGCGLGWGGDIPLIVEEIIRHSSAPLILDADGLNALSLNINILKEKRREIILTPHMGEFRRLFGENYAGSAENDPAAAMRLAGEHGAVIVMKGHRTITADGERAVINLSGNAGMAKGGSGDTLSGIISSLAAQGLEPFRAASLGVALHGAAGDAAAEKFGEYSVLPSDLIGCIPTILKTADWRKETTG